jgi:hypothetical protein
LTEKGDALATIVDEKSGAKLVIFSVDHKQPPALEQQFISRHYGSRAPSTTLVWASDLAVPCRLRWVIVPICAGEDEAKRLRILKSVLA